MFDNVADEFLSNPVNAGFDLLRQPFFHAMNRKLNLNSTIFKTDFDSVLHCIYQPELSQSPWHHLV